MNSFKRVYAFQIELEFESVGFFRKGEVPRQKPLGARERTNNKFNPHMAWMLGFEPGPHLVGSECSHHCTILWGQDLSVLS